MADVLYHWPDTARVGSRVPKEKFYEQGSVSPQVRARFVSEVARITWAYKLADATINLPDSEAVPEIQVFRLEAKDADVSDQVLTAIDKAIPSPIIFEVARATRGGSQVQMTAAYKQPGSSAPKLSQYLRTEWLDAALERQPLPTAISLPTLYAALLEPMANVEVRPGEAMSEVAERLRLVASLEREIAALRRKIKNEKQLNRKIEMRRLLKERQATLSSVV